MKTLRRLPAAVGMAVFMAAAGTPTFAPAAPAPPVVTLPLAEIFSFRVSSTTLLARRGYVMEYLFEAEDEEELTLHAATPQAPIMTATYRTILDGVPSYAILRRRGDPYVLKIVMSEDEIVGVWITDDGDVLGAPFSEDRLREIIRTLGRLLDEARAGLGLQGFQPMRQAVARVRVDQVDTLRIVTAYGFIQRYELIRPGTQAPGEVVSATVHGETWTVTWQAGRLTIRIETPQGSRTRTFVDAARARRERLFISARWLLAQARAQLGTAAVVGRLP